MKALVVLALIRTLVFAVSSFALTKKTTAERLDREVKELAFADWSENAGAGAGDRHR